MSDDETVTSPILKERKTSKPDPKDVESDSEQDKFDSIDDVIDNLGFGWFQIKLMILCGTGILVESLVHAMKQFLMPLLKEQWELNNWHLTALSSGDVIGMTAGAMIFGRLADRVGRRPMFLLSLFISALFGFLSAISPNIYVFIMCRAFLGVGVGANNVIDTVLLAEFMPTANRGRFLALLSVFHGIGHVLCVGLAWIFIPMLGWRAFVAIAASPAFFLLFFRRMVPESPRYMLLGEEDGAFGAKEVLAQVAHENGCSQDTLDKLENTQLMRPEVEEREQDEEVGFLDLFVHPMLGPITILLSLIWWMTAMAGTLIVWLPLYVAENQSLHKNKKAGMHMNKAYAAALATGVGGLIGTLFVVYVIAKFDRRKLLRAFFVFIAVTVLVLGFLHSATGVLLLLPVLGALKKSLVSLLNVYTPELYPTSVRTSGLGVTSASHRLALAVGHVFIGVLINSSFLTLALSVSAMYTVAFALTLVLQHDTRNKHLAGFYYDTLREESRCRC